MASYGAATQTLLSMAGGVTATVDEALASADQEIDEAFAAGGYSVPLDLASLPASDAKTRLVARLASASKNIAAWRLSSPAAAKQGTPDWVRKNYENERLWLDRIAGRLIVIGILGGSAQSGLSIVGDVEWRATPEFFDFAHLGMLER